MPKKTKYNVYIAIHKAEGLDFMKYRHVGLWFVPDDGSSHFYYHVIDAETGGYAFERRRNFNPTQSNSFATLIIVGTTETSLSSLALESLMKSVSVANHDPEFNCQQWVDFAMRALHYAGYLTPEHYQAGLEGMTDAVAAAQDEDLA